MNRLRGFLSSMAGRLFVVLLVGMLSAAVVATLLVNTKRHQDFRRQEMARTADRLQGYVELLEGNTGELRQRLLQMGGPGVHPLRWPVEGQGEDKEFTDLLAARNSVVADARVERLDHHDCMPKPPAFVKDAQSEARPNVRSREPTPDNGMEPPRCRLVTLSLQDGTRLRLALETPAIARDSMAPLDPLFLGSLALAIALLAYVVSRMASAPLQRLANQAIALGQDLQREPMPVTGPTEVKAAANAFNAMQQRLQRHLGERTQMLAAITHDLQTPLTRLRLRLENVDDESLRERLIGDLAAMQALIREGLELARSAETAEQKVSLDLDSLLESLVEDAAEAGGDVQFEHGCGAVMLLRPLAMHRLFSNLIENALKYGGLARVAAERRDGRVVVRISDRGPGLPVDQLEAVFDPFVRLETSRSRETGGAGLGLTIARTLAEKAGASLALHNREDGGLEAVVEWNAPPLVRAG